MVPAEGRRAALEILAESPDAALAGKAARALEALGGGALHRRRRRPRRPRPVGRSAAARHLRAADALRRSPTRLRRRAVDADPHGRRGHDGLAGPAPVARAAGARRSSSAGPSATAPRAVRRALGDRGAAGQYHADPVRPRPRDAGWRKRPPRGVRADRPARATATCHERLDPGRAAPARVAAPSRPGAVPAQHPHPHRRARSTSACSSSGCATAPAWASARSTCCWPSSGSARSTRPAPATSTAWHPCVPTSRRTPTRVTDAVAYLRDAVAAGRLLPTADHRRADGRRGLGPREAAKTQRHRYLGPEGQPPDGFWAGDAAGAARRLRHSASSDLGPHAYGGRATAIVLRSRRPVAPRPAAAARRAVARRTPTGGRAHGHLDSRAAIGVRLPRPAARRVRRRPAGLPAARSST